MYYVYALYSEKYDKIYIGYTSDLDQRLLSHNHEKNRGYTGKYRPWRLLYSEAIDSKSAALVRERQLKSYRGREYLRSLIP
jgi:putative endonuclease